MVIIVRLERRLNEVALQIEDLGVPKTVVIRLVDLDGLRILEFEDDDYWQLPDRVQTQLKDVARRVLVRGDRVDVPVVLGLDDAPTG